jgi:SAM-dependent methyltransferase
MLCRATDSNRRLSPLAFDYFRCPSCGLVFLVDPPADLGPFYPADYYSLPASAGALASEAAPERYKIELVKRFVTHGRLLEIGPGRGNFCYLAREAGFDTTAIERSAECCEFLEHDIGVEVLHAKDEVAGLERAAPADVIAMWHVLEHLREPWRVLCAAASALRPGGVLVIATPNPECAQFRLFGARWAHLDAPRHLFLVPSRLLLQRAQAVGLSLALVTTRDEGSLGWNRFGWAFSCANYFSSPSARRAARAAGRVISLAASFHERREGRGAAYTAIFHKVPA